MRLLSRQGKEMALMEVLEGHFSCPGDFSVCSEIAEIGVLAERTHVL